MTLKSLVTIKGVDLAAEDAPQDAPRIDAFVPPRFAIKPYTQGELPPGLQVHLDALKQNPIIP